MSDEIRRPSDDDPNPSSSPRGPISEDVTHFPIGARIPEKINRGVFCTAAIVLQTSDVFVIDFLSTMVPPQQVGARVVMTVPAFVQFLSAMRTNLAVYEEKYGKLTQRTPLPAPATPPVPGEAPVTSTSSETETGASHDAGKRHPQVQVTNSALPTRFSELYDQLKLPDEMLGGAFSNVVMIRHASEEYCLDFIANFYPRAAVTARVFLPAGRVPSMLEAMTGSFQKYRKKVQEDASRTDDPTELD